VKFLNEFPSMPNSEAPVEHLKKILGRNDKNKSKEKPIEIDDDVVMVQPPVKQQQIITNDIQQIEEKSDLGMTPAELRKNSEGKQYMKFNKKFKKFNFISKFLVPGQRKDKRRGTKWGEPIATANQSWAQRSTMQQPLPPVHLMNLTHFNNPLDTNPFVLAVRAQSQMALVVPQSLTQPILNTKLRTLRLDGTNDHLLRFYNETAIIFNEVGEPRDIRFSAGQCRIIIDDQYSIEMSFNAGYKPIIIEGVLHQIKFGTPTRELYIDNNFYECYFNNQTTQIVLNDKIRMVRIEGHAPEVKIGAKRNDLVLGMINIVIDANAMIPVFLDTTIQYFEYKGKIFTLQFADFFLTVILNNEPFKVEFGDMPKCFTLNGEKHFIRFTGLPDNVQPGRVNLLGMRRTHLYRNCRSPPIIENIDNNVDLNKAIENDMRMNNPPPITIPPPTSTNITGGIPGIVDQVEVPEININDLLQKLVANGIIGGNTTENSTASSSTSAPPPVQSNIVKESSPDVANKMQDIKSSIRPVNLSIPETIKKRQKGIVDTLYSGIQCSSCGLRFPPEQTMRYSQHLDWHFRQNRRERDSKRKAHFRKWYYNQSDWIKYEEIEDADEKEKNFFEIQQESSDVNEDGNSKNVRNSENIGTVSCPADADDVHRVCDMCHDGFEQFFNEETEEWHLRNAIKIDEKVYHPICYEDFKVSLKFD
jgi:pre-mRNA cleavage complex 2 protein Pcf11